jgi:hypothetical protein
LTAQGSPRSIFQRAIEHGNVTVAEATARELGRITLAESLALTALVAALLNAGRSSPTALLFVPGRPTRSITPSASDSLPSSAKQPYRDERSGAQVGASSSEGFRLMFVWSLPSAFMT